MPATHPLRSSNFSATPAWWQRSVRSSVAAGWLGATVLGTAGVIEVARAWTTTPRAGAEASHVVGGMVVALLGISAFALGARARAFTGVSVAAAFALVAHGGTLVLEGQTVGALFLGIAPLVALLSHVAFTTRPADERAAVSGAKMVALWMKTSRRKTAPAARRVASPIPLAMRASQATIIDA